MRKTEIAGWVWRDAAGYAMVVERFRVRWQVSVGPGK